MEPDSATYRKICTLAAEFKSGKIPSEDEVADWSGQEWELYLENLSTDVEASQVCVFYQIIIMLSSMTFSSLNSLSLCTCTVSFRQLTYMASMFSGSGSTY
jgi:hypothetical protein